MAWKTGTYKERGCYTVGQCFKRCASRSKKNCEDCLKFSNFKPLQENNQDKH